MAVDDIWQVTLRCQQGDQAGINVLHYVVSESPGTEATANDVADYFDNIFSTPLKALLVDSAQYLFTEASKVFPLPASVRGMSDDGAGEGGWASDPMPRQTCGLITKVPASGSGFRKGRCYVPFPSEDDNDESAVPSTTYVTRLEALAAGLFQVYNLVQGVDDVGVLTPRLWRRGGGTTAVVTGTSVRRKWATQRRRGSYGRANFSPV